MRTAALQTPRRRCAAADVGALGHPALGGYWLEPAGLKLPPDDSGRGVEDLPGSLARPDWDAAIAATSFVPARWWPSSARRWG